MFTMAGLAHHATTRLDIPALAAQSLQTGNKGLPDKIKVFDQLISTALPPAIASLRKDSSPTYKRLLGKDAVQAVFAGWENNRLVMFNDNWNLSATGKLTHPKISQASEDRNNFWLLGTHDTADAYWTAHPELARMTPTNIFLRLIQIVIDRSAASQRVPDVGPPISVVKLTSGGRIDWI
ncbi:MAG TPA: hypothetical protein VK706_10270, partial [Candidatus Sulfotelmatobacter sp.]|nr:hypothetical protein [Candidatus Sulfotelmatobacter sp.]